MGCELGFGAVAMTFGAPQAPQLLLSVRVSTSLGQVETKVIAVPTMPAELAAPPVLVIPTPPAVPRIPPVPTAPPE
jgi:hypothetical protein